MMNRTIDRVMSYNSHATVRARKNANASVPPVFVAPSEKPKQVQRPIRRQACHEGLASRPGNLLRRGFARQPKVLGGIEACVEDSISPA
jgi:hypothetical protein